MGNWQLVFVEPVKTIVGQLKQFLGNIFMVLGILIVGWIISLVIKKLLVKLLRSLRLDVLSERIELKSLLAKGGINYGFSELVGVIFYWLGLLVTFVIAVNSIGLTIATDLLNRLVLYIPNIIAAIFILVLGMFLATLFKNIILTAASNAGLSHSRLLAKAVEVVIAIFAVMIALEELNIGAGIIELMISIVLGSLGLAFALALGFGCQDLARKTINDLVEKLKTKK
ncbi:MAG: hypothetical protein PHH68_03220 [Candidatus Omnitrophica bacterium]|jgi:hypothetical protein|nr:hypothetical protein [Candidatus Omnitrophota bacterium]MDD5079319.1 hypothetical protein [Candidatus Omnitrophota bacterium]MDD5775770.1 hypothetical protein [Candidatus Omnitrophota bacterium]